MMKMQSIYKRNPFERRGILASVLALSLFITLATYLRIFNLVQYLIAAMVASTAVGFLYYSWKTYVGVDLYVKGIVTFLFLNLLILVVFVVLVK